MNTFISDAAKFQFYMHILFLSSLNTIGLICFQFYFQFYFNVSSVSVIPEITSNSTVSILNPIPKLSSNSLSTGHTSVFELEGDAQVTIASTGSIYIGASPSSTITGKVTQLEGSSLVEAGHATWILLHSHLTVSNKKTNLHQPYPRQTSHLECLRAIRTVGGLHQLQPWLELTVHSVWFWRLEQLHWD